MLIIIPCKRRFFKRSSSLLLAFVLFVCCPQPKALAGELFSHNDAGFSCIIPQDWQLDKTTTGVELSRDSSLLSVENLAIRQGEMDDVLQLFDIETGSKKVPITKPYTGVRVLIDGDKYTADIAFLKTEHGYYLLSLEESGDEYNLELFQQLLDSFRLIAPTSAATKIAAKKPLVAAPKLTRQQQSIATQASNALGVSLPRIAVLIKQHPELYKELQATVALADKLEKLATLADPSQRVALIGWQTDKNLSSLLGTPHKAYLQAIKQYHTSLALLPVGLTIPPLDTALSRAYSTARAELSAEQAYQQLKPQIKNLPEMQQMLQQLRQRERSALPKDEPKQQKYLSGKFNNFWKNRLEDNYQQGRFKQNQQQLLRRLWAGNKTSIERL